MARRKVKVEDQSEMLGVVEAIEEREQDVDIEELEGEFTLNSLREQGLIDEDFEEGNSRREVDEEIDIGPMKRLKDPEYRKRLVKATTAQGTKSLNNGDPIAKMFEGKDLMEIYEIGSKQLDTTIGALREKYCHLNPGQIRMNIGNRIRGKIRKEEREAAEMLGGA